MKASDKFKTEIHLKEEQIAQIKSNIDERNTLLSFKDQKGFFGFSQLTGKERFSISRKYYLQGKEISKSEFDKSEIELNELHKTDYETIKLLTNEIEIYKAALERALFEELNKSTGKNKGKTSRSFERELHDIITIVTTWKNIEGNYSQSKLAAKMNKNRSYITRLFAYRFTYRGIERTFKQHLIECVQAGIESARESKYGNKDEAISRLNYFHDCLVQNRAAVGLEYSDRKGSSKLKGKIKKQY